MLMRAPFPPFTNQVIVLHGGLFSQPGVSLEDLMAADRKIYSLDKSNMMPNQFQSSSPEKSPQTDDDAERQYYLIQLVTEMLWSDPQPIEGRLPSPRGEGIIFGVEPTIEFLRTNDLRLIVRSHECVRCGFDQPFVEEGKELLCTIFSASNYAGSGNHGAFMMFTTCAEAEGSQEVKPLDHLTEQKSAHVGASTDAMHKLYYTVHSYGGNDQEEEQDLRDTTRASLANLILRKKESLRRAFEAEDVAKRGEVSVDVFAKVMEEVTQIHVEWLLLLPLLLPGRSEGTMVDYNQLLGGFQLQLEGISTASNEQNRACFDGLYVNRRELEAMFAFFDRDKNGSISRDEFRQGCEALNAHLPAESHLTGLERVMDLLDFDRSGTIEVAEFFEGFRFMDLRDGKEDGKINISTKSAAATT
jgi:Ca2+-binding EF-hand superfamily protein/diadenosine tetraphosphatase ApaH/serine/threonine PP2A family protein phosphatase